MKIQTLLVVSALLMSGSALLAQDSYNEMMHRNVAKYRLAVQQEPNNAQAQEHLATALYTSNYRQLGNAVHCDPASPAVQDEAIAHLRTAIMLQPNHYEWQSDLGLYVYNKGRYPEAILALRKSLHLLGPVRPFLFGDGSEPTFHQAESAFSAHSLLGDALSKTRHYAEAEAEYHRAMLFGPGGERLLLNLGLAENGQGNRSQARAVWQEVILLSPRPTYYGNKARLMLSKYPEPK